jgi:hypothetical protein
LENEDIAIDISSPGGFLAYMSGSGEYSIYCFTAGGGAYNLQNYFTIQEKGTTIGTYYENTTEITHTFESSDVIVVKRNVEALFDSVTWHINGVKYAIAENANIMNTLNFPASSFHSGENTLTMSVRFSGTTADSLYIGKVWLSVTNYSAEFYANDVHHLALNDTTFCNKNVYFRAEIEELHPDPESLKWFIDYGSGEVEEESARDQLTWNKPFENGIYPVRMWLRYDNDVEENIIGTLKIQALWIKMKNVRY